MTVGVEVDGQRYVSREGKEGKETRYYRVSDIPAEPQFTAFRIAARIWFGYAGKAVIARAWGGDSWDVEVTYPGLNVIEYPAACLTFLAARHNDVRDDTSTSIDDLRYEYVQQTINGEQHRVVNGIVVTNTVEWTATIQRARIAAIPCVHALIKYIEQPYNGGTIEDLLSINLNTVKKHDRAELSNHRSYYEAGLHRLLADIPTPADSEGLVLKFDGEPVKIVPKEFVHANQFEHAVRNMIKRRTFTKDVHKYVPEIDRELVEQIDQLWKVEPSIGRCVGLIRALLTLQRQYYAIHKRSPIYRPHVHLHTMVEFASFIGQLQNEYVNTP